MILVYSITTEKYRNRSSQHTVQMRRDPATTVEKGGTTTVEEGGGDDGVSGGQRWKLLHPKSNSLYFVLFSFFCKFFFYQKKKKNLLDLLRRVAKSLPFGLANCLFLEDHVYKKIYASSSRRRYVPMSCILTFLALSYLFHNRIFNFYKIKYFFR